MQDDVNTVLIDGRTVRPARLKGSSNDAFSTVKIVFERPRWAPDNEALTCYGCKVKFSAVKRKHHCRQCGEIFCNGCCKDKILLPYLGYNEPEKICDQCYPYIQIFVMSFSTDVKLKVDACSAWSDLCKHTEGIKEVLECGALHAMIHMSKFRDKRLQKLIIQCFQSLALHNVLHSFMLEVGTVKVICRYLNEGRAPGEDFIPEVIGLLTLFCKDPPLKLAVIQEGVLVPLLQYVTCLEETVSLMALQCVSLLCDQDQACDIIVNCQEKHYLSNIFTLTKHKDEQIREVSLRILASISSGSDYHRQRILQEEVFSGGHIASVLTSQPTNVQVLVDAACLVANLAATQSTQGGLRDHLEGLCSLIPRRSDNLTLMRHVARGLANFSGYRDNADLLSNHFATLVRTFLMCEDSKLRHWAFKISLALLEHNSPHCISVLQCEGITTFLHCLSQCKDGLQSMRTQLNAQEPSVIKVTF